MSMILNVEKLDPGSLREASFIDRLVGGIKAKVVRFREEFQSLASQIDRISLELERNQDALKRDVAMLDGFFAKCLDQLKFLEAYIAAGGERLEEVRRSQLVELQKTAAASGTGAAGQIVAQQLADLRQALDRLERRLHDLKLSRVMGMQTLPQMRLIQNGNVTLVEKLQSSLTHTIPAWKQQMTVALASHNQSEALELQRKVESTNGILRKNAEQLRTGATGIEQETQRGIVDIETLAQVQRDFAATLNEVLTIQQDGRAKRRAAEQEMLRIKRDLKPTLVQAQVQTETRR
jgi:uncharacterized protein YaaN involved in tellurite resistance